MCESSLYLNRPPQCWHWSPTQPGEHTQLPVAALHWPFIHGLSHSFAWVKPGCPESSTVTESSSAVVSIGNLRPPLEPEQARRVEPNILSQKMAALRHKLRCFGDGDSGSWPWTWLCFAGQRCSFPVLLVNVFGVQGRVRWVLGLHLSVVLFPSAAPSRILTSRSDVTKPEMRPGGGGRALNDKI